MRKLKTVAEVEALPRTAVIETIQGYALERLAEGWYRPGVPSPYTTVYQSWLPAKLLRKVSPSGV